MKARDVITDALEWLNRLSPGETLDADTAAFMLRRLNAIVDEWSASAQFLFRDLVTSTNQSGNITLGEGAWAEVTPGAQIIAVSANSLPLSPLGYDAYITLTDPTITGAPGTYTYDGASSLLFYPVPSNQVIKLLARVGVAKFADLDTDYAAAPGYESALGVSLAVRAAPTLLGGVPAPLVRAETRARNAISRPQPSVVDNVGFQRSGTWGGTLLGGGAGGGIGAFDVLNGNTP